MLILELAVQGVRGFSTPARASLKAGYTLLKSPTEVPAPMAGLLVALLYPDGRGGDSAFLAPGQKVGRAGLTVQRSDQTVYRLVRELGGAGALNALNKQTNQFEVASQDSAEIGQMLRSVVGFPTRSTFEQIFTLSVGQLPSRKPKAAARPAGQPPTSKARVQSSFDQYDTDAGSSEPKVSVEKLAVLEQELAVAKEVADLQFKMDGVQAEAFKADQLQRAYDELLAKVAVARGQLLQAPSPQSLGLPDDIGDRVRRSADEKKKRAEALERLEAERRAAGVGQPLPVVPPVWNDPRFLVAMGVGVALVIAGGTLGGLGRFVALLAIPSFTLATLLALRFIEALQFRSRERAKVEVFEVRRRKIDDEFGLSASIVQTALNKAEASTADEFFTVMARRTELVPVVSALEAELAVLESDPSTVSLADTVARLKDEHETMNERLLALSGGYARDVREIEREISRMKDALAGRTPAAPPEEFSAVPTGPSETFEDPCPAAMRLACEIFTTDSSTLWGVLRARCVQYLTALTDKRYHGVDLDVDGKATVQAPGREVPAADLPGRDLDLLYLSLRLTLAEKAGAQTRLPLIVEDAFGAVIDAQKQALFARMLKHISTLTQVLHVIGASQTPHAADVVLPV